MQNILNILAIISMIMESVLIIYFLWLFICDIIGLFCKNRKFNEFSPYNFAVIICARNEEITVGNLIDSLIKQNYPEDKRKIFVVANNFYTLYKAENEPSKEFQNGFTLSVFPASFSGPRRTGAL
ncbi:MAG: hypothetical protein J6T73_07335 [Clostridia bacterium]|nr:hypothetical protein [Clostridia bacterium]